MGIGRGSPAKKSAIRYIKKPLPIEFFINNLNSETNFSFVRYGDGEAACILGESGENCDGHQYFLKMRDDLRRTIEKPKDYYYGLLRVAKERPKFLDYTRKKIGWYFGDSLLEASCAGTLLPFIQSIRRKRICYIGPERLKGLTKYFSIDTFIDIPEKNCYLSKETTTIRILESFYSKTKRPQVYLFSSGMPTKVFVYELYDLIGSQVTMLDMGSMFDIYMGYATRKYARTNNWNELIFKNTGIKL